MLKSGSSAGGFTLVELLTVLAVAALLVALGLPIMGKWLKNNEVRTAGEALQNGLRFAQTQAVVLNLETAVVLANSPPANATNKAAVNPASGWYSTTVTTINGTPLLNTQVVATGLQTGALGNVAQGIQITAQTDPGSGAPLAVCFNSFGRLTANSTPGPANAQCALPTAPANDPVFVYVVSIPNSDRPLHVTVGLTGQVRMCDPAKTLSATNPDGC